MEFVKAHGTGNDFVVILDVGDALELPAGLVRALCDRHTGIGADGLIRIGGQHAGGDVFMDYRNADGGVVEMCGNGVRVVAKVAIDLGVVPAETDTVDVGTRDGVKSVAVTRHLDGTVAAATVDMGPPGHHTATIPATPPGGDRLMLHGYEWTAVSMGNPHVVTIVDDVVTAPVATVGPAVERDAAFPAGTNVEFAHVVDRDHVDLRVWERGVGETMACGTGACATVVALQRRGLVDGAATVRVLGGDLTVRYRPDVHASVFLSGPAETVAAGRVADRWLRSHRE